jgi:predicted permease
MRIETILQDVRYAARMLARSPGFTAVAVLTLAIAIAATTTVFTWVDAVLLQPLPGLPPGEGTYSVETNPPKGHGLSYPELLDCQTYLKSLSGLAASQEPAAFDIGDGETPQRVWGELVTNNYLAVLGARPILGRLFRNEENSEQDLVGIISYRLWQTEFHGDRSIVGRTVRVNKNQMTIIGVMPPQFGGAWRGLAFDMWVPLTLGSRLNQVSQEILQERGARGLLTVARLKPGVSLQQARAEVRRFGGILAKHHPSSNMTIGLDFNPELEAQNNVKFILARPLGILLAMCGVVLLIAGANVANLLLARSAGRQKEFSLRLALGASRERLTRQLLTEALLLAAIGTAVALPLAFWARQSLSLLVPPVDMPIRLDVPFNGHILGFSILLCVAAAVISGLVPALHAARPDLVDNLKEGGRGGSAGARAHRLRDLLVAGEVALAMLSIAGAGLFAKSFRTTTALDPGFDPHNVLVAKLYLSPSGYTGFEQRAHFVAQVKERLEAMPGVAGVSYAESIPMGFQGAPGCGVEVGGYIRPPGEAPGGDRNMISPGYFRVMKTPLLAGREFTDSDTRDRAFVAVVNQEFARHYMAGRDPLGVTIRACGQPTIIVGLVRNSKSYSFVEEPRPVLYLPLQQRYGPVGDYDRGIGLFLRSSGEVKFAVPLLRSALKSVDPAVGVYDGMAYEDYIGASVFAQKVAASLLSVLGGISLLLAAMGLYSVMAYSVSQRTHEIGIRMALGGQRGNILGMVLKKGLALALTGIVAGILAALACTQAVASLLLGVSPADPLVFTSAALFLLAIAALATILPARTATQVDPLTALHCE